jgi:hypothetical protein
MEEWPTTHSKFQKQSVIRIVGARILPLMLDAFYDARPVIVVDWSNAPNFEASCAVQVVPLSPQPYPAVARDID